MDDPITVGELMHSHRRMGEMDYQARDLLRYFYYEHLQEGPLQDTSRHFFNMAMKMVEELPPGYALTKALEHLSTAKDWAVRAALDL
jgi:hypothetical protein